MMPDIPPLETLVETSRKLHDVIVRIVLDCSKELPKERFTTSLMAISMIWSRICRTHLAAIVLVENHLPGEAVILETTEFELFLDLLYLGQDLDNRAKDWLEHSRTEATPWNVGHKIATVFPTNQSAAKGTYELLCSIKRGNPAAGSLGFYIPHDQKDLHPKAMDCFAVGCSTYIMLQATLALIDSLECAPSPSDTEALGIWKDYLVGLIHQAVDTQEFYAAFNRQPISEALFPDPL